MARKVLLQAGAGLCAAHQAGLVHRDFKPENVMVANDGRVRVLDFGLASVDREIEVEASADPRPALAQPTALELSLTRTGALLGTPAYMSPEQLRGERSSVASDCFGFCVVAHEALYGQRPFAGDTVVQLRDAIMDQQLCPIPRDRHVPAPLRTAILAGLASAPGARPSMQTLLDVLGRYATRTDSAQAPDPRTIESRVTLLAIATWVAILGATLRWAPARSDLVGAADPRAGLVHRPRCDPRHHGRRRRQLAGALLNARRFAVRWSCTTTHASSRNEGRTNIPTADANSTICHCCICVSIGVSI